MNALNRSFWYFKRLHTNIKYIYYILFEFFVLFFLDAIGFKSISIDFESLDIIESGNFSFIQKINGIKLWRMFITHLFDVLVDMKFQNSTYS